jgi:hypothetical protein
VRATDGRCEYEYEVLNVFVDCCRF